MNFIKGKIIPIEKASAIIPIKVKNIIIDMCSLLTESLKR